MNEETTEKSNEQKAADSLGLPWRLEVVFDDIATRTFTQLVSGKRFQKEASEYWLPIVPWYMGFALGIYAALEADLSLLACIILVNWIMLFRHHWATGHANMNPGVPNSVVQSYIVIINEAGLIEIDRGVESRAGWGALQRWFLWRSILFIELTNFKWAIIPSKDLKPSEIKLESIASYLKIKGVPGQKLKDD
ncbi:MAG: hypothetical protein OJI67_04185 [Prosthecobacter sp.]|nr:hypothetical protein [Prosthecobacter sp.]